MTRPPYSQWGTSSRGTTSTVHGRNEHKDHDEKDRRQRAQEGAEEEIDQDDRRHDHEPMSV